MNGLRLEIPGRYGTFFERLVNEGRAEYIWGPHCPLHWQPWLDGPAISPDARFNYVPANVLPIKDLIPGRAEDHDNPPKWER